MSYQHYYRRTFKLFPFIFAGCLVYLAVTSSPYAYGEPTEHIAASDNATSTSNPLPAVASTMTTTNALVGKPVFKENEQSSVSVHPLFNDDSTNIAFYIKCTGATCPSNSATTTQYVFSAENTGHGTLAFSDYWAPPSLSEFVAVEYKNDHQQFTCSDKSLDACKADPHLVAITNFAIVSNDTIITPEMIEAQTSVIITTGSSSISSPLGTSTIITTTIDGLPIASDTPATTSEETPLQSFGSFMSSVFTKIIDAILPGDQSGTTSTKTELDEPASTTPETEHHESSTTQPTEQSAPTPADTSDTAPQPENEKPTTSAAPVVSTPPAPTQNVTSPADTTTPAAITSPDTSSHEPITVQF